MQIIIAFSLITTLTMLLYANPKTCAANIDCAHNNTDIDQSIEK